jgi:hypothetical protein
MGENFPIEGITGGKALRFMTGIQNSWSNDSVIAPKQRLC